LSDRYLLYIDLLGFAEMTVRDPRKIARLYSIIDSLNAHRHDVFRAIVFSDTLLVYNHSDPSTDEDKDCLVWYLIEFAEDLHHRLTGQDIYFRGIVCSGDFEHYELKNIQCFYGGALVNAYLTEKDIGCAGLFIDDHCNNHNKYFHTAPYSKNLNFVYLNRHLEYLDNATGGKYPTSSVNCFDDAPYLPHQIRYLKDIFSAMRHHPSPRARAKLLANWDFHSARYPALTDILARNQFDISAITPNTDWSKEIKSMEENIRYFKRLGAGSKHSIKISNKPRKRRNNP
jgi:hypothetical protein